MVSRSASDLAGRFLPPFWIAACVLLGGSTAGGVVANALLQFAAIVLLAMLALRLRWSAFDRPARQFVALIAAAFVAGLLSLVPLPPSVWTLFPGRESLARGYNLLGGPLPWLGISLDTDGTVVALLSLLPPAATFLLLAAAPPEGRRAAIITLIVLAFASVLYGVMQQVSGYNAPVYIYDLTSRGGATGFFANRNHLATLCLMTMPFLAAMIAMSRGRRGRRAEPGRWAPALFALLLLVVGTIVVESRAGWILLLPTLLACGLMVLGRRGRLSSGMMAGLVAIVSVLAIAAALFFPYAGYDASLASQEANPQQRHVFMQLTWQALWHYFPIGTGWGSFQQVYPQFESARTVTPTFINHAHFDYLELGLELGIGGMLLGAAFLLWWGARIRSAWQSGGDPVARAATVAIGIMLAHSFVDYPARTAAIACIAAMCCALAAARSPVPLPERRRGGYRERSTGTIMLGVGARPQIVRNDRAPT